MLESIKQTLASGRLRAARAVNNVVIETYWQIGHEIGRRRSEQGWGARVIHQISADLKMLYPEVRALSVRSLWYMTALANRWPSEVVQRPVAQLPWGCVVTILDGCSDLPTSEFYASRAAAEGWTRAVLQAMIETRLHERATPNPALNTFDRTVPEADREALREIVKDPYVLDFLTDEALPERDLRRALI